MGQTRYIRSIDEPTVYIWTERLAEKIGFFECDVDGHPVGPTQGLPMAAVQIPEAAAYPDDGLPYGSELKSYLESLANKQAISDYAKRRWGVTQSIEIRRQEMEDELVNLGERMRGMVPQGLEVEESELQPPQSVADEPGPALTA